MSWLAKNTADPVEQRTFYKLKSYFISRAIKAGEVKAIHPDVRRGGMTLVQFNDYRCIGLHAPDNTLEDLYTFSEM